VAVLQDDAAAAAVELEPQVLRFVPLEALPAGRGRAGRAGRAGSVAAGLREGGVRQAGRLPAVVFHPVRDRVAGVLRPVTGPAEPLPDLGGELLLLGEAAGGEAAPGGRGDETGQGDGFGVGGGEDPGGGCVNPNWAGRRIRCACRIRGLAAGNAGCCRAGRPGCRARGWWPS
jgi:hypothetical protein